MPNNYKNIGYDYGTTTSLLEEFDGEQFVSLARCGSSREISSVFIPSPKRLIRKTEETSENGEPWAIASLRIPIRQVISEFTESCLLGACTWENMDRLHLTLTIPDSYTNFECQLMRDAVNSALSNRFGRLYDENQDLSIISEPVAAAFYYTYQHLADFANSDSVDILTCDIGGGTTDLAIVRVRVNRHNEDLGARHSYDLSFNVLGTNGDIRLGGNDINEVIIKKMSERYHLSTADQHSKWVWNACEELKIILSDESFGEDEIRTIYAKGENGNPISRNGQNVRFSCSRKNIEEWVKDHYRETDGLSNKLKDHITTLFEIAAKKLDEINKRRLKNGLSNMPGINPGNMILLPVGGSMRMPLFRKVLQNEVRNASMAILEDKERDFDSVVRGAALFSAYETKNLPLINRIEIEYRTPYSISVGHSESLVKECVPRNASAGDYGVSLYPLRVNEDQKTFELSDLLFYQSPHKVDLIQDAQLMGKLEIGDKTFEVKEGKPSDTELCLKFQVDQDMRHVKVQLSISNVREFGSSENFGTFYFPSGNSDNNWYLIKI